MAGADMSNKGIRIDAAFLRHGDTADVGDGLILEFRLGGNVLDPAELSQIALPEDLDGQRHLGLMLSGKGPNWLYGHLVHLAHAFAWVAVYDPRLCGGVVVMRHRTDAPALGQVIPFSEAGEGASPAPATERTLPQLSWSPPQVSAFGEVMTLQLRPPGGGHAFHHADLADLRLPAAHGLDKASLFCLSGQFPMWLLAAALVKLREQFPGPALAVYQPPLAGSVVVSSGTEGRMLPGMVVPDQPRGAPAPVVALVGDPNSGKSVLSWKLYHALQLLGRSVYRLDCDASAPTAGWCLDNETGRELRKAYKKDRGEWRQADVDGLVKQVSCLRQSRLDVALLDMPGGLHEEGQEPVRIPAGRERLFALADAFVLLERDDAARQGWLRELGRHGLADRVVAGVRPRRERDAEEVCPAGGAGTAVPVWTIRALDREFIEERTAAVESLANYLAGRMPETCNRGVTHDRRTGV
jgi:CRISPR-associated Csx3 family protein